MSLEEDHVNPVDDVTTLENDQQSLPTPSTTNDEPTVPGDTTTSNDVKQTDSKDTTSTDVPKTDSKPRQWFFQHKKGIFIGLGIAGTIILIAMLILTILLTVEFRPNVNARQPITHPIDRVPNISAFNQIGDVFQRTYSRDLIYIDDEFLVRRTVSNITFPPTSIIAEYYHQQYQNRDIVINSCDDLNNVYISIFVPQNEYSFNDYLITSNSHDVNEMVMMSQSQTQSIMSQLNAYISQAHDIARQNGQFNTNSNNNDNSSYDPSLPYHYPIFQPNNLFSHRAINHVCHDAIQVPAIDKTTGEIKRNVFTNETIYESTDDNVYRIINTTTISSPNKPIIHYILNNNGDNGVDYIPTKFVEVQFKLSIETEKQKGLSLFTSGTEIETEVLGQWNGVQIPDENGNYDIENNNQSDDEHVDISEFNYSVFIPNHSRKSSSMNEQSTDSSINSNTTHSMNNKTGIKFASQFKRVKFHKNNQLPSNHTMLIQNENNELSEEGSYDELVYPEFNGGNYPIRSFDMHVPIIYDSLHTNNNQILGRFGYKHYQEQLQQQKEQYELKQSFKQQNQSDLVDENIVDDEFVYHNSNQIDEYAPFSIPITSTRHEFYEQSIHKPSLLSISNITDNESFQLQQRFPIQDPIPAARTWAQLWADPNLAVYSALVKARSILPYQAIELPTSTFTIEFDVQCQCAALRAHMTFGVYRLVPFGFDSPISFTSSFPTTCAVKNGGTYSSLKITFTNIAELKASTFPYYITVNANCNYVYDDHTYDFETATLLNSGHGVFYIRPSGLQVENYHYSGLGIDYSKAGNLFTQNENAPNYDTTGSFNAATNEDLMNHKSSIQNSWVIGPTSRDIDPKPEDASESASWFSNIFGCSNPSLTNSLLCTLFESTDATYQFKAQVKCKTCIVQYATIIEGVRIYYSSDYEVAYPQYIQMALKGNINWFVDANADISLQLQFNYIKESLGELNIVTIPLLGPIPVFFRVFLDIGFQAKLQLDMALSANARTYGTIPSFLAYSELTVAFNKDFTGFNSDFIQTGTQYKTIATDTSNGGGFIIDSPIGSGLQVTGASAQLQVYMEVIVKVRMQLAYFIESTIKFHPYAQVDLLTQYPAFQPYTFPSDVLIQYGTAACSTDHYLRSKVTIGLRDVTVQLRLILDWTEIHGSLYLEQQLLNRSLKEYDFFQPLRAYPLIQHCGFPVVPPSSIDYDPESSIKIVVKTKIDLITNTGKAAFEAMNKQIAAFLGGVANRLQRPTTVYDEDNTYTILQYKLTPASDAGSKKSTIIASQFQSNYISSSNSLIINGNKVVARRTEWKRELNTLTSQCMNIDDNEILSSTSQICNHMHGTPSKHYAWLQIPSSLRTLTTNGSCSLTKKRYHQAVCTDGEKAQDQQYCRDDNIGYSNPFKIESCSLSTYQQDLIEPGSILVTGKIHFYYNNDKARYSIRYKDMLKLHDTIPYAVGNDKCQVINSIEPFVDIKDYNFSIWFSWSSSSCTYYDAETLIRNYFGNDGDVSSVTVYDMVKHGERNTGGGDDDNDDGDNGGGDNNNPPDDNNNPPDDNNNPGDNNDDNNNPPDDGSGSGSDDSGSGGPGGGSRPINAAVDTIQPFIIVVCMTMVVIFNIIF